MAHDLWFGVFGLGPGQGGLVSLVSVPDTFNLFVAAKPWAIRFDILRSVAHDLWFASLRCRAR